MTIREHSPRKQLFSEWTNRGFIGLGVVLILLGLPMTFWLMTYPSDVAVGMWIVTWLSLTFFVLLMAKKSVSDPGYRVDGKVIDRTRQEIETHRKEERKQLLSNEIQALRRGERTPVLDVWKLDGALAKRHIYFESTKVVMIDRGERELQIQILIGELGRTEEARNSSLSLMFNNIIAYLRIIASDPYLWMERGFFDRLILVVDALREDERHVDVPYSILSLQIDAGVFWSIKTMGRFERIQLQAMAQIRFDDGTEIQPHRFIDLPAAPGIK